MKFEKQSFEILEPIGYDLNSLKKHVEICGRTCYKSLDKITEDSSEKFVQRMIDSKHYSTLEHAPVYLKLEYHSNDANFRKLLGKYFGNPYSKINSRLIKTDYVPIEKQVIGEPMSGLINSYITTNLRVIYENGWEDDLQYMCEPTKYHINRYTVRLNTCIHVYKDLTRHRKMSFSIESTRYCNYSKDKFGGELKFILPPWLNEEELNKYGPYHTVIRNKSAESIFIANLNNCEKDYNELISLGWQPQQAAEILPQCTAAEVIMSGFADDWEFVFRLRTDIAETGQPHPLVKEIMNPLYKEFIDNNYIQILNN